jgi:hypothetical protein
MRKSKINVPAFDVFQTFSAGDGVHSYQLRARPQQQQ